MGECRDDSVQGLLIASPWRSTIFNESIKGKGYDHTVPRRISQRPLSTEAQSIEQLDKTGDYLTIPSIELANELVQALMDRPSQTDLLKAAIRWFKKYPKKLDHLSLLNDLGEVHKLTLKAPPVSEVW